MNILLIEDQINKIESIKTIIEQNMSEQPYEITEARCLSDARRHLIGNVFDLIIFDVYLPERDEEGSEPIDVSADIISEFTSNVNYQTEAIAITQFDIKNIENIDVFNQAGVTVVHYSEECKKWQQSLSLKLYKILDKVKYDFLIFCALNKERSAYSETDATLGGFLSYNGLNCQTISIGNFKGLCITPDRMGLVNMAITASKAIELYQPKIVAMSGICAGVRDSSNYLDLIIGELCWEYQTGKLIDNEFKQEPYQVPIDQRVKTDLSQLCESENCLLEIKKDLHETELKESKILLSPISSGSAVIADADKMNEIGMQHRKMAGLEMEMYSLYEAAKQSLCSPLYFGAKAVVDFGDSSKGNVLHATASIISARFVINYLKSKLPELLAK